jgi:putative transposase
MEGIGPLLTVISGLRRKLLKRQCRAPRVMITNKLGRDSVAQQELIPGIEHRRPKRLNNCVGNSHQPTQRQERQTKRFKSAQQA